jgi:predicted DCC family thiol-disulfide oxidoreductase YuxK
MTASTPKKTVVLYDGDCSFCVKQAQNLLALVPAEAAEVVSFREPGVLDRFPQVSLEACMRALHLVTPDGRVYSGFEAAVHALATRPGWRFAPAIYYLPGVRQVCDLFYWGLCMYRNYLLRKAVAMGACAGGTCSLHVH